MNGRRIGWLAVITCLIFIMAGCSSSVKVRRHAPGHKPKENTSWANSREAAASKDQGLKPLKPLTDASARPRGSANGRAESTSGINMRKAAANRELAALRDSLTQELKSQRAQFASQQAIHGRFRTGALEIAGQTYKIPEFFGAPRQEIAIFAEGMGGKETGMHYHPETHTFDPEVYGQPNIPIRNADGTYRDSSSAVGKYQFIKSTRDSVMVDMLNTLHDMNFPMNEEMQQCWQAQTPLPWTGSPYSPYYQELTMAYHSSEHYAEAKSRGIDNDLEAIFKRMAAYHFYPKKAWGDWTYEPGGNNTESVQAYVNSAIKWIEKANEGPIIEGQGRLKKPDDWVYVPGVSKVVNPLPGSVITSDFGVERTINGEPSGRHEGVDMDVEGDEFFHDLYAVAWTAGVVERSGESPNELNGYDVVLDHGNGLKSYYLHGTAEIVVVPGQIVQAGEPVLGVGNSGRIQKTSDRGKGQHLHFELQLNGVPVNPHAYGIPFGGYR